MTGLVDAVREKVSPKCLSRKCSRPGCSVPLKDAPNPRLIIDFDKPDSPLGERDASCDFLLIAENGNSPGWVAPLELKRGGIDASQVIKQLQAGARAAERLIPQNEPVRFRPVAASGSRHRAELNKLKQKTSRIRFHGSMEYVRLMSCGAPLIQALGQ